MVGDKKYSSKKEKGDMKQQLFFHPHKVAMGFMKGSKGASASSCVGLQHKLSQRTSSCERHAWINISKGNI